MIMSTHTLRRSVFIFPCMHSMHLIENHHHHLTVAYAVGIQTDLHKVLVSHQPYASLRTAPGQPCGDTWSLLSLGFPAWRKARMARHNLTYTLSLPGYQEMSITTCQSSCRLVQNCERLRDSYTQIHEETYKLV